MAVDLKSSANNNNNNKVARTAPKQRVDVVVSSGQQSATSADNDDVVRGAARKLEAYDKSSQAAATLGDRKILLLMLAGLSVVMLIIDALGLSFVVARMFQGDGKTLLAAFSISLGINASQIFALVTRFLFLHFGDFKKREVVLRQTTFFRSFLALGSIICVCILLAGLFVSPTEDFASNINPQLAGCGSIGCATIMAALGLVLNAANVCWLLSTMFTVPSSFWFRWHNGLDVSAPETTTPSSC